MFSTSHETVAWVAFSMASGWAGAQAWFMAEKFQTWKEARA